MPMIREWRELDYEVRLIFLSLNDPEEAIARVAARVKQGGHHIPEEVVRRRFYTGRKNFENIYKLEVDLWRLYNNSGERPVLIDRGPNCGSK